MMVSRMLRTFVSAMTAWVIFFTPQIWGQASETRNLSYIYLKKPGAKIQKHKYVWNMIFKDSLENPENDSAKDRLCATITASQLDIYTQIRPN